MNEAVLDASVVLKWFHDKNEVNVAAARELRARFEAGELKVLAPPLLWLEAVNVAARSWRWDSSQLEDWARTLLELRITIVEPELAAVARWAGRGLTAYDATYVALAERSGAQLITDDGELVRQAPDHAVALVTPGIGQDVREADQNGAEQEQRE